MAMKPLISIKQYYNILHSFYYLATLLWAQSERKSRNNWGFFFRRTGFSIAVCSLGNIYSTSRRHISSLSKIYHNCFYIYNISLLEGSIERGERIHSGVAQLVENKCWIGSNWWYRPPTDFTQRINSKKLTGFLVCANWNTANSRYVQDFVPP